MEIIKNLPDDIVLEIYIKHLKRFRLHNGTLIKLLDFDKYIIILYKHFNFYIQLYYIMESVNNETNNNLKKIIAENNYLIDYKNYYLTRMIKLLINFILTYGFLEFLLNNNDLSKIELILLICTFSSVLLYILDSNFPACSFTLN